MSQSTTSIDEILLMEPLSLLDFLKQEVRVSVPASIDTESEKKAAIRMMNRAVSWICYLRDMEVRARLLKRALRSSKSNPDETARLLGIEEVFEAYRKNCESVYEAIAKQMTMKRLQMDEAKIMGTQT